MDIQQLCEYVRLEKKFIYKLRDKIPELNKYIHTGEKNKLIFDDNAVSIFQYIASLKNEKRFTVPSIKKSLLAHLNKKPGKEGGSWRGNAEKSGAKRGETDKIHATQYMAKIEALHDRITESEREKARIQADKDSEIRDLTQKLLTLEGSMKMLPDGKAPEIIKQEYEEARAKEAERAKLLTELELLRFYQLGRRKNIISKLKELG